MTVLPRTTISPICSPFVMVDQGVEDRRHRQQPRDPVALDVLHERDRVEATEHDVAPAHHRQEMGHAPAVDVEKGHDVEDDVVLAEAEGELGLERVEGRLAVGQGHALREPGRPARTEELGDRVLVDLVVARIGRAIGEQRLVLVVGEAARLAFQDHDARPHRKLRQDRLDQGREVAVWNATGRDPA